MLQCATVFNRKSAATNSVELNTAKDLPSLLAVAVQNVFRFRPPALNLNLNLIARY
jgi:hypothetical protein